MSLYIRLQSSFWNHRKTLRLRATIGDAAFWVLPRLWSYAADNQPDGDFSDYTAEELAMLIGYSGNAQAMLQAMQQACWLDGMKIHGWDEHNGYHATFSERAKKAAAVRWDKEKEKNQKKESTRKDRKGKETSIASGMLVASKSRCSQAEAEDFCASLGLPKSDGEAMFLHWEEKGWAKVVDWKATIRKWRSFGYMPSQKGVKSNGSSSSPPRFLSFEERKKRKSKLQDDLNEHFRAVRAENRKYTPEEQAQRDAIKAEMENL